MSNTFSIENLYSLGLAETDVVRGASEACDQDVL